MKEWLKAQGPQDVAEFYDRKYLQYGKGAFTGDKHEYFFDVYEELFGIARPTDRILDCGCGHAEFFEVVLSKWKFRSPHMTGIDISAEAVKLAKKRFRNYEYQFELLNLSMDELVKGFPEPVFDVAVSWGSIEHSRDPLAVLFSMLCTVKPGGIVMITVPLEFEGCLDGIKNEPFDRNNERFMAYDEWVNYFSAVKKPIMTRNLDFPDMGDLLMVFRQ